MSSQTSRTGLKKVESIPEKEIQNNILQYFKSLPSVVWVMIQTNGKIKGRGGHWMTLGYKGMGDIIGQINDGRFFTFEVKRPGESPSDSQLDFIDVVENGKGYAGWGCSIEDAILFSTKFIKNNKKKPTSEKTKGTRLQENWTLPPEWNQWAKTHAPHLNILLESEKFKDYWLSKAGNGAIKTNWERTWRNWIRNAAQYQRGPANEKSKRPDKSFFDDELF